MTLDTIFRSKLKYNKGVLTGSGFTLKSETIQKDTKRFKKKRILYSDIHFWLIL